MVDDIFREALGRLLVEIFEGPPAQEAYILNPGDIGLLRQLDAITAAQASTQPPFATSTIAAHAAHLLFGIDLLNRWGAGEENPWDGADWNASWRQRDVTEVQWHELRASLRRQSEGWRQVAANRTQWDAVTACGAIASVAHTAYHLGSIRQMLASIK